MEQLAPWIALATFIGLPLAVLLLVAVAKRRTRKPAPGGWDQEQRLTDIERVTVHQDDRLTAVEQRLAALEQDRAPLYRVQ